jgi:hypothetical protein
MVLTPTWQTSGPVSLPPQPATPIANAATHIIQTISRIRIRLP